MFNSVKAWWGQSASEKTGTVLEPEGFAVTAAGEPAEVSENEPSVGEEKVEEGKDEGEAGQTETEDNNPNEDLKKAVGVAKEWGNYFYSFGKKATVAAAKSVSTTAKQLKDTVDTVGDKVGIEKTPVLGSFSKEQRDFVESRRRKKAEEEASVAPWCGYDSPEAEEMRNQILALSSDERNFLRNPPKGAQYCYDSEASAPVAMAVLAEDPLLRDMRFKLVPKRIKEDIFWRNYFYRVSLIKQSTDLSRLAHSEPAASEPADGNNRSDTSTESYDRLSDAGDSPQAEARLSHAIVTSGRQREPSETEVTSHDADFVSDSSTDTPANRAPLSKEERRQLGMGASEVDGATMEEWEAELQRELNEFELVDGANGVKEGDSDAAGNGPEGGEEDDALEREIMEQLEADERG